MEIILAQEKDIKQVANFYDRVTGYLESHINYPLWQHKVYPSVTSVTANVEKHGQYMVVDDGEVIGAFVLNDNPEGAYERGTWSKELKLGEYTVVHGLAVREDKYGLGIGGKMVEFCIAESKERGYKGVRLDVVPKNYPAIKLYEKYGFKYVGEEDLLRGYDNIPKFMLFEYYF